MTGAWSRGRTALNTVLAVSVVAVGCGSRGPRAEAIRTACAPVEGRVGASAPWDSLLGNWRLTLVATSGPTAGRTVLGNLTLSRQDAALRRIERPGPATITVPVIGTVDMAIEQVGAVRMGNLLSADPQHPGAAIWVSQGADGGVSAVLRIGEEAIRSDLVRFDGGYTALFLRQVSLRGSWASGVTTEQAGGHFCAVRAN